MSYINEFLFAIAALFVALYFYFTRNFNHWKDKNVPFIKPLPFFGNMIDGILIRRSMGEIFADLYKKTEGPVLGFFILDRPCLLIKDPDLIKKVFINDFHCFHDRSILNNKRDDPIGTHILFNLKNPEWKEVRTKVSPIFTPVKMKIMSKLIKEASDGMIRYLQKTVNDNPVVEMKDVCIKFTVDVITSCIFGVNAKSFEKEKSEFYTMAKRLANWDDFLTSFRVRCYFIGHTLVKLFRMKMLDPIAIKFLENRFWEIMKRRADMKNKRNDLIDILLQMKNDDKSFIEGDVLASQAVVFFAAGFETSSSTISFALYELSKNPEIQSKLRNEIEQVYQKYGDLTYESLKEMEYLDMCVKEVLRKYPVVPVLERHCNTHYTLIPENALVINKGTTVFISTLSLHYDPQYFPNPKKFDPERFSEANKNDIQNFVYLPFGEGPRNCIGARFGFMTVKFGLVNLLRNFIIEDCNETPKEIKFNPNGFLLAAIGGIKLKVKKISESY